MPFLILIQNDDNNNNNTRLVTPQSIPPFQYLWNKKNAREEPVKLHLDWGLLLFPVRNGKKLYPWLAFPSKSHDEAIELADWATKQMMKARLDKELAGVHGTGGTANYSWNPKKIELLPNHPNLNDLQQNPLPHKQFVFGGPVGVVTPCQNNSL